MLPTQIFFWKIKLFVQKVASIYIVIVITTLIIIIIIIIVMIRLNDLFVWAIKVPPILDTR